MTAPTLTRRLVLEAPQRVDDGAGGYSTSWSALGVHWAHVSPRAGREASGMAGPLSRVPLTIAIRAVAPGAPGRPVPGQRFREGARIFAILAVTETDGAGRYLTITAEEEIAA